MTQIQGQILIAESSSLHAKTLTFLLSEICENQPLHAPTVMGALQQIKSQPFDLIMTNTTLQRQHDGLKLVQLLLLQQTFQHPLVMIVTMEKEQSVVLKCVKAGVVDYIVYPYDPENLLQRVRKALAQHQDQSEDQEQKSILDSLEKILELPTISPVYTQIEMLVSRKETSAEDVARVIEIDVSITAKVLRLSNSAFFGFTRRINSVKDAVSLIGFQSVRAAVAAVSTFEAMGRIEASSHFNREGFWVHSIGCSAIAKLLANKLEMDPDQAFVAGLLHDLGKVVLDGFFPEIFAQALQAAREGNRSLIEVEKELLPVTHEEVGRHLGERWNLPEPLLDVIGAHHSLSPQKSVHARLVRLVHIANAHCSQLKVGQAGDNVIKTPKAVALEGFGITEADLAGWKPEIEAEIEKAQSIGRRLGLYQSDRT